MKIRTGLVSNSSSASFVIPLAWITQELVDKLLARGRKITASDNPKADFVLVETKDDSWKVCVTDNGNGRDVLCGSTIMDNGGMSKLLKELGFPEGCAIWESDG